LRNSTPRLLLMLASIVLMSLTSLLLADEASQSAELYEQGMKYFATGDLQNAKQTLESTELDPLKLPKEKRVKLFKTLEDIENLTKAGADPKEQYNEGTRAKAAGNIARASSYFKAVTNNPKADDKLKQAATARLAEIRRSNDGDLARAQRAIAEAVQQIQAGDLDAAERKLQMVKDSGVQLGWFDSERVERQLALIQQKRRNAGAVNQGSDAAADSGTLSQAKQLYVQEKLAEARAAERKAQYRLAAQYYQAALKIDPNNETAKSGLASTQAKDQFALSPRGVLQSEKDALRLRQEATISEYRQLINRALALSEARNYSAALEAVSQAKTTLDRNERSLSAARYRELREEAVAIGASIEDSQRQNIAEIQRETDQKRIADAEKRKAEAVAEQERQIQVLLVRAIELRREQKYERALEQLRQAEFLDRTNPAVQLLKEAIEDLANYDKIRQLKRQRDRLIQRHSIENTEASLPHTELMTFPSDWPALTERRLGGLDEDGGESEANRRVMLKLREPVPINFENHKLVTVLQYLQETTGVDIVVNWTAMQNVGVEQDLPITLRLSNVPAIQALDFVMSQASAGNDLDPVGFSISEGIVRVSTVRELKRQTVKSRTYDIRDLLVQIPSFEEAPSFDLSSALEGGGTEGAGAGGGGGGGGSSIFSGTGEGEEDGPDRQELIDNILEIIRTQVGDQEDWVEFGGDVSSIRELNGLLIVNTTPENQTQISDLLSQLRQTRSMQISVEARFLLVDQNFLDEIGVDIDIQIGDGGEGDNVGPIKIGQDSFGQTNRPIATGLPGSFGSAAPAIGEIADFAGGLGFPGSGRSLDVSFFYLDDWGVNVMIRASQASRRAIGLTAPRITFFNGQRAFVTVARQIAFISDLEPVPDADGFNPTLSVTQSGVVLDVEGTISADRRYVTMTVRPSLATIAEIRRVEFLVETSDDDDDDDDDDTDGEAQFATGAVEAPQIELTTLSTTVSVPDKGTLLLGGQRLVGDIEIEAGVPVLSKIPVIKRLFTNRTKVKDERILLILIKPTIIIQAEEEETLFPGLQQNPSQYNIGRQF